MSNITKNILFASDYISKAASLLEDICPEISESLIDLSNVLSMGVPNDEFESINEAEKNILEEKANKC